MTKANTGTYLPDPSDTRLFGLDISSNQGNVDFYRMLKPEGFPTIKFVACRTGISWAYKDSWFETYWRMLGELGFVLLAYHVLYPGESIQAQVENMASRFPNGFDGDGVVNDLELHHGFSKDKISQATYEFTNRLRDWSKKPTFIYSRFTFIEAYCDFSSTGRFYEWSKGQLWWMANYYGKDKWGKPILKEFPTASISVPAGLKHLKVYIHQTGEKGDGVKVGTVSRQVDTNRWTQGEEVFNTIFAKTTEEPQPHPDPEPKPIDITDELAAIKTAVRSIEDKIIVV